MDHSEVLELDDLRRGRACFRRRMWMDAFKAFCLANETEQLRAEDLWLLAWSAYLIGRDDDFERLMEGAHHAQLMDADVRGAVRSAFWLGFTLASSGQIGPATGWLARAERLVEREVSDCVERGYVLLAVAVQKLFAGEYEASFAASADATEIGERFGDADLIAFTLDIQGCSLIRLGRVDDGLTRLDEAMVAVTAGELSPFVTGVVYCSVIEACQEIYELRRAQEWTAALTRWCEGQPDLVPYAGQCLVHRSEVMALRGAWRDSLDEAGRASERFAHGVNQMAAAAALYQQAEVHRLLGDYAAAEHSYREASLSGREPQPGLALLRLSQGARDAAVAAIRRVAGERADPLERARMLPAFIEIMLAVRDVDAARDACRELHEIANYYASDVLGAMAAGAQGAIDLVEGDARTALAALRHACRVWQELDAPHAVARTRELIGLACRALGDNDTAALELDAARGAFELLGAAPDLARIDSHALRAQPIDIHGLTAREVEVLQLVTAGKTNRAIAADLFISERTVDRHVSNLFTKLGVASRAAATSYAHEHRLL
jgi:DNA-binding NarL/FixJ family response regulator